MTAPFIGIQFGPQNAYDEGIDHCLDLMQETARVNTLVIYTHQTHDGHRADHGKPFPDRASGEELPVTWVRTNPELYVESPVRPVVEEGKTYGGRDILDDLKEPAAKRGMKLYARILEGWSNRWAGRSKFLSLDVYGQVGVPGHDGVKRQRYCYNHPGYRNYWLAVVEDLFAEHPWLDGFKYGSESDGPLTTLLEDGRPPYCFCEHCEVKADRKGIDVERARIGFRKLHEHVLRLRSGDLKPAEGALVSVFRILYEYPEIIAWDREWHAAYREIPAMLYGVAKTMKPDAGFGIHTHHGPTTLSLFERVAYDYSALADSADWIKPVVYHQCAGWRVRKRVEEQVRSWLGDFEAEDAFQIIKTLHGYSGQPGYAEAEAGFTPEYVYREIDRCVREVDGKCQVLSGMGFDVPHFERTIEDPDADQVYESVVRSFDAGADGLLISREYVEMKVENLKAVGRAVDSVCG